MTSEPQTFFDGLRPILRRSGFETSQGTATGMNVFFTRQRKVTVTVNFAPRDDRVSVKLTVNRGQKGGANPLFDALHTQFKPSDHQLGGAVEWETAPLRTESKVQVATRISSADNAAHYDWVLRNASVLRAWAKWLGSVRL